MRKMKKKMSRNRHGLAMSQTKQVATQPNSVFILTDDQRYDTVGALGIRIY